MNCSGRQVANRGFATDPLDRKPPALNWNYDRNELLADGVVHAVGLGLALVGIGLLAVAAGDLPSGLDSVSIWIYGTGLLTMLGLSAAYNIWPVCPLKWYLRRLDHSAIYLMIAATYTPFIAQVKHGIVAHALLVGIWLIALAGISLKLLLPGRFDRLSIGLYLLLGWSGMMAYEDAWSTLASSTLWLIAAGGMLYSAGVIFHLWDRLRYQNAIWHGFVLAAAACHYAAVLDCLPSATA